MGNHYTDVIQRDPRYNSANVDTVIKDVMLLEPGTRAAVLQMQRMAAAAGHTLVIGETYRSQRRQSHLFTRGATKLKTVGCHGYGLAADLQLFVRGKYDPDGGHYIFVHTLSVRTGLISGQGWGTSKAHHTFVDADHVQRIPLFRQESVFAGTWYPPVLYDPWRDMVDHHIAGIG